MGFGGHALDMIKKLEQNNALRKANRERIKESRSIHSKLSKNHVSKKFKRKEFSDEELENAFTKIKTETKKERRLEIIIQS